jgi:radical SAM protein with 4Fe4S-binding SPASM domain
MEWDLFAKIAQELASETLLPSVAFELHNEPLLDKRIFDWVKYLKSISPDKRCAIVTNGELLDSFSSTDIRQSIVDSLVISLNAHSKEIYESINNGLDYDRVMNNISCLTSDQSLRQKVMLSFVLTEQNVHEVYQAMRYWRGQGVRTRVIGVANRAGTLDNYEVMRPKTEYYGSSLPLRVWRYLMAMARGVTGCPLPFYQMNVLFNGDVILCCHDWNRASVVGNAGTSSLREVWNSERMNEIRRSILRKRYQEIASCQECSLVR